MMKVGILLLLIGLFSALSAASQPEVDYLWLVAGALALALLWFAVLTRAIWLPRAGAAFLALPFVAAAAMTWPGQSKSRVSAVAVVGLGMLFCLAWYL